MDDNQLADGRKLVSRIEFNDEQQKIISESAGRKIRSMNIMELPPQELKVLAPGMLRGYIHTMCW